MPSDDANKSFAGLLLVGAVALGTLASLTSSSSTQMAVLSTPRPATLGSLSTSTGFSRPIPLPLSEPEAKRVMSVLLRASSTQAEAPAAAAEAPRSTISALWGPAMGLALVFCGALLPRKPLTVSTSAWHMAAEQGSQVDDNDFDDMVAKLKARGEQAKSAKSATAGIGFDKDAKKKAAVKQVVVEEPENFDDEELFTEVKPSPAELIIPIIATFFVIGIFPLATGIVRQLWVRYRITSRRICITSGWGGKEYTEVSFKKIKQMKFVRRNLGFDGDLVMELTDGGAVDMQGVPDFVKTYNYIYERISPAAREKSEDLPLDA